MTSAGRILIMPKGEYDANKTYERLDLVSHNGTSWLAKKASTGIEPSTDNIEYWQDMFNIPTAAESVFDTKIKYVKADDIGALSKTYEEMKYESASDTDEGGLQAWLGNVVAKMANQSSVNVCVQCGGIGTATYYGTLTKNNETSATLLASAPAIEKGIIHKVMTNNSWLESKVIAYTE